MATTTTLIANGFIPKVRVIKDNKPIVVKRFKLRVK